MVEFIKCNKCGSIEMIPVPLHGIFCKDCQTTYIIGGSVDIEITDDELQKASEYIIETQFASINNLIKEFDFPFNKARKIMFLLAENGIVSKKEGINRREVLVKK